MSKRDAKRAIPRSMRVTRAKSKKRKRNGDRRATTKLKALPIDARLKTIALAAEPAVNRDLTALLPAFAQKLQAMLNDLEAASTPFKFVEGFRTVERQQWLYGSGRPSAKPYGRPGPIVTHRDGVTELSNHQGDGTAGSGRAADCYPMKNGKVYIPPDSDPVWKKYADTATANGLSAGYNWTTFKDAPHVEVIER